MPAKQTDLIIAIIFAVIDLQLSYLARVLDRRLSKGKLETPGDSVVPPRRWPSAWVGRTDLRGPGTIRW